MASGRPSAAASGGGGFLNNVAGVITNYEFTNVAPGNTEPGNQTFLQVFVRQDGAEADVSRKLFYGNAENFTILDKGKSLQSERAPFSKFPGMRFIISLCKHGFDETLFPEDKINYEAMIGTRARFVQVVDEYSTKKLGKQEGKDGKEYDRREPEVAEVLAMPQAKVTRAANGKTNGKAVESSIEDVATETLLNILADNGGELLKSKLPTKVAVKLGNKHPQRDAVRKLIFSEDFLQSENGWNYDAKSQQIALA
jgi:hypothetical protein